MGVAVARRPALFPTTVNFKQRMQMIGLAEWLSNRMSVETTDYWISSSNASDVCILIGWVEKPHDNDC